MSNVDTNGLAMSSDIGYVQKINKVVLSLVFPSTTIGPGAWSTQTISAQFDTTTMFYSTIKFSFDTDSLCATSTYSIYDLETANTWFRLAEIDTNGGSIVLRVAAYNRTGASSTVPSFTVNATLQVHRSSFDQ